MGPSTWLLHVELFEAIYLGCHELTGHPDPFRHPWKTLRVLLHILKARGYPRPGHTVAQEAHLCYQYLERSFKEELEPSQKVPFPFDGEDLSNQTRTA